MAITLRLALPEDESFLLEVYASTRAQELSLVPWNEVQRQAFVKMQFEAQHEHYHSKFPDATYSVIMRNGEPVGRLYVLRDKDQMRIMDITILPQYRNSGIGTPLIHNLIAEAGRLGLPLRIYVEKVNPSRALFERLGFLPIEEIDFNILYERSSNPELVADRAD
jgi:N-acetylglutamate synthase-like GNAT family acetyltransferase